MKKSMKLAAVALGACMLLPFAACGDDVPEGSTEISFWYDTTMSQNRYYEELARTYNEGQGKIDGVYVRPELTGGISKGARPYLTKDSPNVMTIDETVFKDFAIDGLYTDLTEYYENDKAFYNENDVPAGLANRNRFTRNTGGVSYAGEGQQLVGLPFGATPYVVLYNKKAFSDYKINIVSCEEKKLKTQYPSLQPHGYAEYLNSPFEGAEASTNLAGETVYKVFNNRIPMNWEEMRYLSKCFTKTKDNGSGGTVGYNPSSPTAYGYVTEWWFNYAWTVGGDCVGYNGEKYELTLGDKTPNYLVTAKDGVTVNNVHYAAGETLRYEDKVKLTSKDGLYELPSTYEAIAEINRFPIPEGKVYDENVPGYGISYPDSTDRVTAFTSELVAMATLGPVTLAELDRNMRGNYDIAPCQQYRLYKDGSVYYNGEKNFKNEYLKVIGKDGYTGELAVVGDTPVTGNIAACAESPSLVVPKNSDPEKHEASWKFIRWAAGPDGQKILAQTGIVPNQQSVALSDDYLKTRTDINLYARSLTATIADIGDWAYFQNGDWVKGWSGAFNDDVRFGNMKFADFLTDKKSAAETAINGMKIVIKGRY